MTAAGHIRSGPAFSPIASVPRLGLNRVEVAAAIGVSVNTVDLMVVEGFLPPPRRWHSRKVWLVQEIAAAMMDWPEDNNPLAKKDSNADEWRASV
jgi:predicted DNA-binding transcriptional regulator AlpA